MERKGLNSENKIKVEELNTKAKQGNAQAQYYLGKMYANGVGIKKNPDVAIDWLNKAALVGVLEAELELAALMEEKKNEAQQERRFKSDPCNDKTARFLSTCR
jgi:TPR repeat protein